MKLFLDTEFDNLVPHNKLISIALVDENMEYFYAELTDTYKVRECSDFVKKDVLPLLRGGEHRMTEHECALKIAQWIEDRDCDVILACDNYSWDVPHLVKLLNKAVVWPSNLNKSGVIFRFSLMDYDEVPIVEEFGFKVHNALDDAMVMSIAHSRGLIQEY